MTHSHLPPALCAGRIFLFEKIDSRAAEAHLGLWPATRQTKRNGGSRLSEGLAVYAGSWRSRVHVSRTEMAARTRILCPRRAGFEAVNGQAGTGRAQRQGYLPSTAHVGELQAGTHAGQRQCGLAGLRRSRRTARSPCLAYGRLHSQSLV